MWRMACMQQGAIVAAMLHSRWCQEQQSTQASLHVPCASLAGAFMRSLCAGSTLLLRCQVSFARQLSVQGVVCSGACARPVCTRVCVRGLNMQRVLQVRLLRAAHAGMHCTQRHSLATAEVSWVWAMALAAAWQCAGSERHNRGRGETAVRHSPSCPACAAAGCARQPADGLHGRSLTGASAGRKCGRASPKSPWPRPHLGVAALQSLGHGLGRGGGALLERTRACPRGQGFRGVGFGRVEGPCPAAHGLGGRSQGRSGCMNARSDREKTWEALPAALGAHNAARRHRKTARLLMLAASLSQQPGMLRSQMRLLHSRLAAGAEDAAPVPARCGGSHGASMQAPM